MRKAPDRYYVVDIEQHTCPCGLWDVSGIPCFHSIAALVFEGEQVEDYVHQYYRTESLATAWESCVSYVGLCGEYLCLI